MSELLGFVILGVIAGLGLLFYAAYHALLRLWHFALRRKQTVTADLPVRDATLYGLLVLGVSLLILWALEGVELVLFGLGLSAALLGFGFCVDRVATLFGALRKWCFADAR